MVTRMVMALRITRMRNVHHFRKNAKTQSAAVITNKPTYHQVLRSRMMYSSACQLISVLFVAISLLYHRVSIMQNIGFWMEMLIY